jgi:hypothetical protein
LLLVVVVVVERLHIISEVVVMDPLYVPWKVTAMVVEVAILPKVVVTLNLHLQTQLAVELLLTLL